MTLHFTGGLAGWVGQICKVNLWLADRDGAPNPRQVCVATQIAESLHILEAKAANYLDLFVDRAKACGDAEERWWLDEIDFREGLLEDVLTYSLHFRLQGDDGGLWTVTVLARDDEHSPFRFERLQG